VKVAYYSPLPPQRSGIADYSALLLPALRERMEILLPKRGSRRVPRGTDVALYHVGNLVDAHGWIVDALRRRPGVVVLHDYVLHHLVAGITIGRGDNDAYLEAMEVQAGAVGRMLAHGVIDGLVPPLWEHRPHEFPLSAPIVELSTGVIVHSSYVEERLREENWTGRVWRIPLAAPTPPPDGGPPALPRTGDPLLVSVGHLNTAKRIPELLRAFARLRAVRPGALLVLAGAAAPGFDVATLVEGAGLEEGRDIIRLDYVTDDVLWQLLRHCDVCVALRYPTMGETSAVALRALVLGRPLVVTDVGWFAELPDEAAFKVPAGTGEVEVLTAALEELASDRARREAMGRAAAAYARREHDLGHTADLYLAALEEAVGGKAIEAAVTGEFARAAWEVGLAPDSPDLAPVSDALRTLRRDN
jgi:glycosyltransferase involved in cell wall biosynthesis